MKYPHRHFFAFTIIELLVVIAIISILASLLLPALHGAREKATALVCLNSYKQVGMSVFNFADDHNGRCVGSGHKILGANGSVSWESILNVSVLADMGTSIRRLGNIRKGELGCPKSTNLGGTDRGNAINFDLIGGQTWGSYSSTNPQYGLNIADQSQWPSAPYGGASDAHYTLGARLTQVTQSSDFILLADQIEDSTSSIRYTNSYNNPVNLTTYRGTWVIGDSGGGTSFRHGTHAMNNQSTTIYTDLHGRLSLPRAENYTSEHLSLSSQ